MKYPFGYEIFALRQMLRVASLRIIGGHGKPCPYGNPYNPRPTHSSHVRPYNLGGRMKLKALAERIANVGNTEVKRLAEN